MSGIGITGFLLIALIALLLFGPNKLPELGRAVGRTLREFKKGANEAVNVDDEPATRKEVLAEARDTQPSQRSAQESAEANRRLPE